MTTRIEAMTLPKEFLEVEALLVTLASDIGVGPSSWSLADGATDRGPYRRVRHLPDREIVADRAMMTGAVAAPSAASIGRAGRTAPQANVWFKAEFAA